MHSNVTADAEHFAEVQQKSNAGLKPALLENPPEQKVR
jgi:hypothetical protein